MKAVPMNVTNTRTYPGGFVYEVSNTEGGFWHRLRSNEDTGPWVPFSMMAVARGKGGVHAVVTDYFAEQSPFEGCANTLYQLTPLSQGEVA